MIFWSISFVGCCCLSSLLWFSTSGSIWEKFHIRFLNRPIYAYIKHKLYDWRRTHLMFCMAEIIMLLYACYIRSAEDECETRERCHQALNRKYRPKQCLSCRRRVIKFCFFFVVSVWIVFSCRSRKWFTTHRIVSPPHHSRLSRQSNRVTTIDTSITSQFATSGVLHHRHHEPAESYERVCILHGNNRYRWVWRARMCHRSGGQTMARNGQCERSIGIDIGRDCAHSVGNDKSWIGRASRWRTHQRRCRATQSVLFMPSHTIQHIRSVGCAM